MPTEKLEPGVYIDNAAVMTIAAVVAAAASAAATVAAAIALTWPQKNLLGHTCTTISTGTTTITFFRIHPSWTAVIGWQRAKIRHKNGRRWYQGARGGRVVVCNAAQRVPVEHEVGMLHGRRRRWLLQRGRWNLCGVGWRMALMGLLLLNGRVITVVVIVVVVARFHPVSVVERGCKTGIGGTLVVVGRSIAVVIAMVEVLMGHRLH